MDGAIDGRYFLIVLGMALVTYLPRVVPLLLLANRPLPAIVRDWLALLPPALMGALVAQAVLVPGGNVDLSLANPYVLPAVVSLITAWRTGSLGLTVVVGMAAAALGHRFLGS